MTKLSDTQCILLSNAAQRDHGSTYPLPSTLKPGGGTTKAVDALISRGFAEDRETSSADAVRSAEGEVRHGVFITSAGAAAIGTGEETKEVSASAIDAPAPAAKASSKMTMVTPAKASSKTSIVLSLLRRSDGATLPELIEATGWLPHTRRAALTGIRKKGHAVERMKRGDATCYRIVAAG